MTSPYRAPNEDIRTKVQQIVSRDGKHAAASRLGVDRRTLTKFLSGDQVSPSIVARLSRQVRTAKDFPPPTRVRHPRLLAPSTDWTLDRIRSARYAQLRGDFREPVALAKVMRTDDALYTAYDNRLAPLSAIDATLTAAGPSRAADAARRKALEQVTTPREVLAGIVGTLANHGIAIGQVERHANLDGSVVAMSIKEWPLDFVKWNPAREALETSVYGAPRIDIVHGDGQWIVFRKRGFEPWAQDACVLPGAIVWAAHAHGVLDWAAAAKSHGQAKIVGELPEGYALFDGDGNPTVQAQAFVDMMQDLVSGGAGAGIRPSGSKTDFVANGSSAWQVFSELLNNREKAAARIYLGTDGTLGSVGGAPGVDIATLFGVATTKLQGDFGALSAGLKTGLYEPWAAVNLGNSALAPSLVWKLPDPDEQKHHTDYAEREAKFHEAVTSRRENGFVVDQATVDVLAKRYGIDPLKIAAAPAPAP